MKKNSQAKVVLITCEPMMINDTTYKFAVIINAAIDTNTYLSYADYQLRKMGYNPVDFAASEPLPLAAARVLAWNTGMLYGVKTLSDPEGDFEFSYLTRNDLALGVV